MLIAIAKEARILLQRLHAEFVTRSPSTVAIPSAVPCKMDESFSEAATKPYVLLLLSGVVLVILFVYYR